MKALILIAGRGTRLCHLHEQPKCLLKIGGVALLDRYLARLGASGIETILVTGYGPEPVRSHVDRLELAAACQIVVNDAFTLGSIVSLARGLDAIDGDLLLLDGDVLFHDDLLERLITTPHENALLIDIGSRFADEEYMAGIEGGRVMALRRGPVDGFESAGEWVGFARLGGAAVLGLRRAVQAQVERGETAGGYEDALASLLGSIDARCVDASDRDWVEIDFPADVARAELLARDGLL